MLKGKKASEETKKRMSDAHKGKKPTKKTKGKISEALKGRRLSKETRRKLSEINKGRKHTEETKKKISKANGGKKRTKEQCRRMSEAGKGRKQSDQHRINNSLGNGGDGNIKRLNARKGKYYDVEKRRDWREKVFERDNYTCCRCSKRGVIINAHHIYPKALFWRMKSLLNNGISLCFTCHNDTKLQEIYWIKYFQMVHGLAIFKNPLIRKYINRVFDAA